MRHTARDAARAADGEQALARGLAARARGALVEAGVAGREVVHARPDDPRGWVLLGSLAHLQGALAEAAALYRRALATAPADGCAHAALAVALTQAGQPVTAQAHFAAAAVGGLEPWSWLRTLRQAREVAQGGPARPWEACATPLFEARVHMSPGTGAPKMPDGTGSLNLSAGTDLEKRSRAAGPGRVAWTASWCACRRSATV